MRVLVANRGEIAVRLIRACKSLGFHSTAIYADEDGDSMHVRLADETVGLDAAGATAYLNGDHIVRICTEKAVNIVLPGYGFLSENAEFAEQLQAAGIVFAGPSQDVITKFGLKHRARQLAIAAGVPVVPGTGVITHPIDAAGQAKQLGYPVMVKATAGGGGMGLKVCQDEEELRRAISFVESRGEALFKNSEVFLEKYIESGRHIEGQIFGNGEGRVLWFGERECSLQRRHQKVLEEAPSPYVLEHPDLRDKLRAASVSLASSVCYKSAGTVEFLVDDETGDFYFLEMNTRLQVEHGVTELAYNIDLVELMLRQAEAEVRTSKGLTDEALEQYARHGPQRHAIEVRLCAENPADDFKPAPGLFTNASFPSGENIRVDTWLERGSTVSPSFDSLLAKVLVQAGSRGEAIADLQHALAKTVLCGPPTNLEFLEAIVRGQDVRIGLTLTSSLSQFKFSPSAIEVTDGGLYTTIQDWPGRPNTRSGVPVSGPMDSLSLRIANMIIGNDEGTECLEITYSGPRMIFHQPAVIALCGAKFDFSIDGKAAKMWARLVVLAGSVVVVGSSKSAGCRAYLALKGGLPNVGMYLGSKSTTPSLKWGGYQGRTLRAGDWLQIVAVDLKAVESTHTFSLPSALTPQIETSTPIYTISGPYDTSEFITPSGRAAFFETVWKVAFSSSRGGIRLEGPPPQWSRTTGGEGGSHPSNMLGYGYPLGGMSFTGDSAVVFTADSPVQSGFICPQTTLSCQMWRLGQLKPGDNVQFKQCSWLQAMDLERRYNEFLSRVKASIDGHDEEHDGSAVSWSIQKPEASSSILYERSEDSRSSLPRFVLRQAGDRGILCDFGSQVFDLKVRARAQQIVLHLGKQPPRGFHSVTRPHTMSVFVAFDSAVISQAEAVATLQRLEQSFDHAADFRTPSNVFHLPMVFDADECDQATKRYMETQRPYATYLPDNIDFIKRNNGMKERQNVLDAVEGVPFLVVASSGIMGLPILIQIDPRKRFTVPKTNPSRSVTPAGALGTGGTTSAIYPVESPGGYLLWGITLPGCPFDTFGRKPNYAPDTPWLYNPFDQVIFHNVPRSEFEKINRRFQMGLYKIRVDEAVFDLGEYNALADSVEEEVARIRVRQQSCAQIELEKENDLLERWNREKLKRGEENVDARLAQEAEMLKQATDSIKVQGTMSARVWKQVVQVGQTVKANDDLLVLEAMKMELAVKAPADHAHYTVTAVLKREGDLVEPGDVLVLLDHL